MSRKERFLTLKHPALSGGCRGLEKKGRFIYLKRGIK
jgi:hypothetical protein